MQDTYNLSICGLYYGSAALYVGQEERLQQRYVQLGAKTQRVATYRRTNTGRAQPPAVCLEANGRTRCFL